MMMMRVILMVVLLCWLWVPEAGIASSTSVPMEQLEEDTVEVVVIDSKPSPQQRQNHHGKSEMAMNFMTKGDCGENCLGGEQGSSGAEDQEEKERNTEKIRMFQMALAALEEEVPNFVKLKRPCMDLDEECRVLSSKGECVTRRSHMARVCALSCDLCNPLMTTESGVVQQRGGANTPTEIKQRIDELLFSMDKYMASLGSHQQEEGMSTAAVVAQCKKRYELCAEWAVRGICELKPRQMRQSCGPACHMCHDPHHSTSITYSFSTPFLRGDLYGVFDAVEHGRILRGWNGLLQVETTSGPPRYVDMKPYKPLIYKPKANPAQRGATIVQFDSFLTEDETKYLLKIIRRHKNKSNNADDDGFGSPSTDARLYPLRYNGKLYVTRTSSRIFLFPSKNNPYSGPDDVRVANPILEQVLSRIELLTGVPQSHLETPIQFDKFTPKQFQDSQSHFSNRATVEEALQRATSKNFFHSNYIVNPPGTLNPNRPAYLSDTLAVVDEQERFKLTLSNDNARVLGLIIFLSDVESGGDLVLNQLGNIRIAPKLGRAVLYPMVMNLMQEEEQPYTWFDDDKKDTKKDGLKEDHRTFLAHAPVLSGNKYVVSFYLRQAPVEPLV